MRTMTISLSPQQASRIQQAVETGDYASNSEVIREALRLWEQREEMRTLDLARLRQAYAEGMASGAGQDVTAEGLLQDFKRKKTRRA
ncbi:MULTISPECIES: type II toxin-antitoxin system ParD family antitoxin [unclassified Beijerinckia]|uniref:type II toxin-antitoxin system ParD family antitoxin n=1 Tax=unclassified Beijerinckia TaxID=2638183 RepID=UPI00089673F3|nr:MULTISPECIES: type II toxin-antitoxin system ParD family antitoxin [unclassified Beijerinckia]MDH7796853.1 antitoxin ParD1/3/4 [Beijerinckia sp. GAS462]SEC62454.1 antitoxin ParD1/3/4 [Beijerinckia sp. 28-YEA-48]